MPSTGLAITWLLFPYRGTPSTPPRTFIAWPSLPPFLRVGHHRPQAQPCSANTDNRWPWWGAGFQTPGELSLLSLGVSLLGVDAVAWAPCARMIAYLPSTHSASSWRLRLEQGCVGLDTGVDETQPESSEEVTAGTQTAGVPGGWCEGPVWTEPAIRPHQQRHLGLLPILSLASDSLPVMTGGSLTIVSSHHKEEVWGHSQQRKKWLLESLCRMQSLGPAFKESPESLSLFVLSLRVWAVPTGLEHGASHRPTALAYPPRTSVV